MTAVRANGIEIDYVDAGPRDGEVIVLIMGLGMQLVACPDAFCDGLAARGFRVVRFDNRDVGLSTKMPAAGSLVAAALMAGAFMRLPVRPPYTLRDMASDTLGLMDALGIDSAHIVGASMGGMIAQIVAAEHPDRVKSLVSLISTSGNPALPGPQRKVLKMVVGGSALPTSLARAALARGIDVFSGYGLSEAGPMLTGAHVKTRHLGGEPEEEVRHRTTAGIAAPLVDLRVVDENMADVPRDGQAVGEIVARTPWLTMGYLNNHEASEQLWGGGYLHTGDVASIDHDGYLRISDRLKDVVKSGGEWISSIALENIIMEKKGVRRVAVIGVKDVKWGERPLALVVLDANHVGKIDEDAIRLHVASYVARGLISKIAIPENVTFTEELPLTSVGKVDKKKLRDNYL
jgi:acyl-CoA synthetase (AMP-forming)/AMP-acid ligase II